LDLEEQGLARFPGILLEPVQTDIETAGQELFALAEDRDQSILRAEREQRVPAAGLGQSRRDVALDQLGYVDRFARKAGPGELRISVAGTAGASTCTTWYSPSAITPTARHFSRPMSAMQRAIRSAADAGEVTGIWAAWIRRGGASRPPARTAAIVTSSTP
jgi:hypothetical protein